MDLFLRVYNLKSYLASELQTKTFWNPLEKSFALCEQCTSFGLQSDMPAKSSFGNKFDIVYVKDQTLIWTQSFILYSALKPIYQGNI